MPGPVYYNPNPCVWALGWAWHAWACLLLPESLCLGSGMGLACLDLSIITQILVSGLWDGPGMPGPVYYNPNPCVWVLGWAWDAWACLL
jgi:hypothetical protein